MNKTTTKNIIQAKQEGRKLTMLTAYDYLTAQLVDEAGIDMILVGDSLGMVALGYETTLPVTMQEMLAAIKAVKRATKNALLIGDMPFLSYQLSEDDAVKNAGLFMKEGGAEAVKLEGGSEPIIKLIKRLTATGIPVMGHLGLTPQSIHNFGGYDLQASTEKAAKQLINEAKEVQAAGAFSLVLEKVPAQVAKKVTENLDIPTISCGAGVYCDGQVLVTADMLGLFSKFKPKFVKHYASIAEDMKKAFENFRQEVLDGKFPGKEHSY